MAFGVGEVPGGGWPQKGTCTKVRVARSPVSYLLTRMYEMQRPIIWTADVRMSDLIQQGRADFYART